MRKWESGKNTLLFKIFWMFQRLPNRLTPTANAANFRRWEGKRNICILSFPRSAWERKLDRIGISIFYFGVGSGLQNPDATERDVQKPARRALSSTYRNFHFLFDSVSGQNPFQLGNQETRRKAISPEWTLALSWFPGFLIENTLCLSKTYKNPPEGR